MLDPLLGAGRRARADAGIWFALRWYLRRARAAYLAEGAANSEVAEILAATAAGARTVEAFGLQERRIAGEPGRAARPRAAPGCARCSCARVLPGGRGLVRRCRWWACCCVGGALHARGAMSLGAVVAAALYLRQLTEPLDRS